MATLKELSVLRRKYKNMISTAFNEFIGTTAFKKYKKSLNLENYTFCIAEERHKSQLSDLLCYQYSRFGKSPERVVFDISIPDAQTYIPGVINQIIENGRMILIIDKDYHIASCMGLCDLCDLPHADKSELSTNWSRMSELRTAINNEFAKNNKMFDQILNANNPAQHYGKWAVFRLNATRNDESKKGLTFILLIMQSYVLNKCNYECMIGYGTNPSQINKMKLFGVKTGAVLKFDNYEFNDAVHMNDYYNFLQNNYNYNTNQLNKLKKKLVVIVYYSNFKKRNKTLSEQVLDRAVNMFIAYNNKKAKL